jgi:hypothetical protein
MSGHGGMGSHHSAQMMADRWLTPRYVLDALGEFDLDPCGAPDWPTAREVWTPESVGDGLSMDWGTGRVWLNPPYGLKAAPWLQRLAEHGRGTALIFARTETAMFFDHVWERASALLFLRGRLTFLGPDLQPGPGNAGAPSVLVAFGSEDAGMLERSGLSGKLVHL